jgi:acyl dehydratase
MTPDPETLVTPAMVEQKNTWRSPRFSPSISVSDIKKWAIAAYWPAAPPPIYWDEDYAKTTRWGGIIAPPEFNPFAWPIHREIEPSVNLPAGGKSVAADGAPGNRGMNGGQVIEYFAPMRPGDVMSSTTALVDWNERKTRLGLTLFSISETRWTNQKGELVKISRNTSIRY